MLAMSRDCHSNHANALRSKSIMCLFRCADRRSFAKKGERHLRNPTWKARTLFIAADAVYTMPSATAGHFLQRHSVEIRVHGGPAVANAVGQGFQLSQAQGADGFGEGDVTTGEGDRLEEPVLEEPACDDEGSLPCQRVPNAGRCVLIGLPAPGGHGARWSSRPAGGVRRWRRAERSWRGVPWPSANSESMSCTHATSVAASVSTATLGGGVGCTQRPAQRKGRPCERQATPRSAHEQTTSLRQRACKSRRSSVAASPRAPPSLAHRRSALALRGWHRQRAARRRASAAIKKCWCAGGMKTPQPRISPSWVDLSGAPWRKERGADGGGRHINQASAHHTIAPFHTQAAHRRCLCRGNRSQRAAERRGRQRSQQSTIGAHLYPCSVARPAGRTSGLEHEQRWHIL